MIPYEGARGVTATCEQGHVEHIYTPDMNQERAHFFASMLDGTSPFFKYPPREYPTAFAHHNSVCDSTIGKCGVCGAWITCTLFGYEER